MHRRGWETYRETLAFRWHDWNGKKLIIDLGAGQGVAMKQAVAIDFYDHSHADHWFSADTEVLHRVIHEQGPVERILPKYFSTADVIVDNYGAFVYSSARLPLLETSFRALRPGGRAYFRMPPLSFVRTPDGGLMPLGDYLQKKHPHIFSIRTTESLPRELPLLEKMVDAKEVLVMLRPKLDAFPKLPLEVLGEHYWIHPKDPRMKFPVVIYLEK